MTPQKTNSLMKLMCSHCLALFSQKRPPWPIMCMHCGRTGGIVERGPTRTDRLNMRYQDRKRAQ